MKISKYSIDFKKNPILFFRPYLKNVVWAGKNLAQIFNSQEPIGEAWLISAISGHESICINSDFYNQGLKTIFDQNPHLFGSKHQIYPNLSKIIDTAEPLSVQIHPNNAIAKSYNSLGKEECWYVLANNQSKFILGDTSQSKEDAINMIRNQQFNKLLQKHEIQAGDFLYVPAGTIHAIPENTTVFEMQQSSDITFRLYDYDRKDLNGKLRDLHIEESCQALSKTKREFIKLQPQDELVNNNFFHLIKITNHNYQTYYFTNSNWIEMVVVKGSGKINGINITQYSAFILTKGIEKFELEGELTVIINIVL